MKNSDFIYNNLEKIERFYESLMYPTNDIRKDFYGMVSNSVRAFYAGHITAELSQFIKNGKVVFEEDLFSDKRHIDCLLKIYDTSINPINALNSTLIITCWTLFETAITTLSEAILPIEIKDELSLNDFDKACKIFKEEKISQETLKSLKKEFSASHLTHVQTWRKFNSLVKFAEKSDKKYERERKDDITFIKLYGAMRNCLIHSNGIYYGKRNYTESFKDYVINFESGKQFTYGPNKELPEFYIDLITELSNIFTALTNLYKEEKFISYPDIETL